MCVFLAEGHIIRLDILAYSSAHTAFGSPQNLLLLSEKLKCAVTFWGTSLPITHRQLFVN